jgi:predicted transcriptional regulator
MAKPKRRPSEDPEETALKAAAIREGLDSIQAGRVVSHKIVREWLKDLAAGRYRPPPIPDKWK